MRGHQGIQSLAVLDKVHETVSSIVRSVLPKIHAPSMQNLASSIAPTTFAQRAASLEMQETAIHTGSGLVNSLSDSFLETIRVVQDT